ncbi:MAG: AsmA-like C-terminal region-containing protein [Bacteroidales bacterium]|nr:AsmA-like C-terminal region-containing protein [Bacteroidales bacterium]
MKKFIKISGIILLILITVMLTLPFVFKGKIVKIVKEEINKSVNAQVRFQKASLSFFRSFPDLTLSLNRLEIIGNEPFENVSLVTMERFQVTIDLKSLFKEKPFEIKKIVLRKPFLNLLVLEDGTVNWDIVKESDEPETNDLSETDEASFKLSLRAMDIIGGDFVYEDRELDFKLLMKDLSGSMKGDLSMDQTDIMTKLEIGSLSMVYEDMTLLNEVSGVFNAVVEANLAESIYAIKSDKLMLNDLNLDFDGSFELNEEDIAMDFAFKASDGNFKQILSLVPAIYMTDFAKVQTEGHFSLDGFMKGSYSEKSFPGFGMNLNVDKAMFFYPDMPQKLENINVKASVKNSSGDFDDTFLLVENFDFRIGENPFEAKLKLKTPISDPDIESSFKGILNLADVSSLIPAEDFQSMKGMLTFNFLLKTLLSDIENQRYQNIEANGNMDVKGVEVPFDGLEKPVSIKGLFLKFSPEYATMNLDRLQFGKSDFSANGNLENYLGYFLSEGTLKGKLNLVSELIDVNELMKHFASPETEVIAQDTTAISLDLPERIEFYLAAKADQVFYENYELERMDAGIHYSNKQIRFDPLKADLLGGSMSVKGLFDGNDKNTPKVNMDFTITSFDIPLAYQSIALFQAAAPIAEKTKGSFSSSFNLKGRLDGQLNPIFESLQGGGDLKSTQIKIESVNVMNKLADLLGNESYRRMITDGINFSFEFVNGRVFQKPFTINYAGSDVTLGGSIGFDQQLDYDMVFQVPFSQLGSSVADGIASLARLAGDKGINLSPGTSVQVKAKITGLASDPKVSLDYKDFAGNLKADLMNTALQELDKQKEQLKEKARDEADKLIQQAREQGDKLIQQAESAAANIRAEAAKTAANIRAETKAQGEKIVAEGKANGLIAERLAIESVKKLNQQADKSASDLENEADKKANSLVDEARSRAAQLILEAEKKAEGI